MWNYLTLWLQLYIVHFGAWMTFTVGVDLYKNGLPELKNLKSMLKTAFIIAAILSVFSSHSHHYLANVISETKTLHAEIPSR